MHGNPQSRRVSVVVGVRPNRSWDLTLLREDQGGKRLLLGLERPRAGWTGNSRRRPLHVRATWGTNLHGELLDDSGTDAQAASPPASRPALTGATKLRMDAFHGVAVIGKKLFAWGTNECGQLGHRAGDTKAGDSMCVANTPCSLTLSEVPLP